MAGALATELVEETLEAVRAGGLLEAERALVVMLSGGRDSVCLLDVAVQLAGAPAVRALHVDYGLRGRASDEDASHCAELCAALGVPLELVRAERSEDGGGNVQAWARELRYAAARRAAEQLGEGARIATGHTASDQVETILYRLASSPGRRALLGMPAADGRLVRPLLTLTREQTAAYCRARRLAWREDESNDAERYARARVRNGLLPQLRRVHPAAEANVLRTAALLREETELIDHLVDVELAGAEEIAIERLAALPPAIARALVIRLAERAAGRFVPQAGERVEEIVALARDASCANGRSELHVGGLAAAVVADGRLRMVAITPRRRRLRER